MGRALKAAEARELIGKMAAWDSPTDSHRGTYTTYLGMIEEVKGKNVVISGDYKWLSNLINLREATDEDKRLGR